MHRAPAATPATWCVTPTALCSRAAGRQNAGQNAALDFYRHAIEADPRHALARAQKAIVMALAGNMGLLPGEAVREEARAEAERALELERRNSEVLGYAGCALADLGDPRRAVPFIQRAVDTNPRNPQASAALGAAHLILGEKTDAASSSCSGGCA